ncbi:UDP-N-acetylglucosamine--N-acetylmuramyl-(pentapeptide) pyrophosphoryl-undecaprenol N-acetylglucosamine transferase [Gammaproteobacteria bacterium]|jgi:UDP-N-acetylglucosamine--N-acetylmuramyl-(pentapeptide) pyrophosphoryl-undecaprenol N-acetylglucosamine transferase|nr:UDP-N-acetylglucosamine--N-acetylmuramyl-(pentapeptide) pyrophosphoryl-undecaprenol N-acetylglucosamine transferase [Gammaproteobacteria bacterium]
MRFLISAAGTGGHVFPALEFSAECIKNNHEVIWMGTKTGLESSKVPEKNIQFLTIPMRGFRGKGLLYKCISIFGLIASIGKTIIFLFQNKINFVVCFGGYISLPIGIAAILCRKQLILHEQNAVMGTSNKLLASFAKIIFLGTPLAMVSQKNTQLVGNPIKRINKHQDTVPPKSDELKIYVTGGSLGSEFINKNIPIALSSLNIPIMIKHQSGLNKLDGVESLYSGRTSSDIQEFYEAPLENILWSDFVICRAGALTLAEVTSLSRGCIMIPLPSAIDNHQLENAKQIEKLNMGLIYEESASPQALQEQLINIIEKKMYLGWQNNTNSIDHFQAAERMLSSILQINK